MTSHKSRRLPPKVTKGKKARSRKLSKAMGETRRWPRMLIRYVVHEYEGEFAREIYTRALEIQESGGMDTYLGDRKRTLGEDPGERTSMHPHQSKMAWETLRQRSAV